MTRTAVHIVDDDAAVRDSIAALLDRHGYATRRFANAQLFLDALGELPFGCILLDIRLPGMNGIELQDELRRRGRQDPVIFVTGQFELRLAEKAMKGGASDFLRKPVDPRSLLRALRAALKA